MSEYLSSATFELPHDDLPALPLWTITLGIIALLTFGLSSVPAIICGHRALAETKLAKGDSLGRSVAIIGLLIGYVGLVFFATGITVMVRFLSSH